MIASSPLLEILQSHSTHSAVWLDTMIAAINLQPTHEPFLMHPMRMLPEKRFKYHFCSHIVCEIPVERSLWWTISDSLKRETDTSVKCAHKQWSIGTNKTTPCALRSWGLLKALHSRLICCTESCDWFRTVRRAPHIHKLNRNIVGCHVVLVVLWPSTAVTQTRSMDMCESVRISRWQKGFSASARVTQTLSEKSED